MVDTVKLRRPKFARRPGGPGGRVEHDALGNAVWTRTRASDSTEPPDTSALSIVEDKPVLPSAGPVIDRKQKSEKSPGKPKTKK
jgi:hypothetical protein